MITPQVLAPNLAKQIGLNTQLYLKREDLHPFGSHKGRSIPLMIKNYAKDGWRDFVISSSGNAALAALYAVHKYNQNNQEKLNLKIFVGNNIESHKLETLSSKCKYKKDTNCELRVIRNPKQQAFLLEKTGKAKNLRQSTDDLALLGYYDLAKELSAIDNLEAIFVPTSSGTTAQGLFEGFKKLKLTPQIHIVQTTSCHPFVGHGTWDEERGMQEKSSSTNCPLSLASAIVDKIAHRKKEINQLIKDSHGSGWIATNEQIRKIIKLVKETENIDISPNSTLSLVGLTQSLKNNKYNGNICCLITGR